LKSCLYGHNNIADVRNSWQSHCRANVNGS
jgi:hypothetical protein